MKKITNKQIKLIAACFIVVLALFCFLVFVYKPQGARLRSVKQALEATESQIAQIDAIIQGRDISEAVKDLNSRLISAASLLPENQEDIISGFAEKARELKIDIKIIAPKQKVSLGEKVSGYIIEELPVSVNFKCGFKNLGEFLKMLRDDFPDLIRVKKLTIKSQGEGKPILDVNLEILAYLAKVKS